VKFGIAFLGCSPDRDYKRAYDEMIEQTVYAEELGFESAWWTEHHRSTYGVVPRPPVLMAAVAERTSKIRLGIGVAILPYDNPVRTAEDYAMVDVLSNGRLDFAAGRGYQPREFELMRADPNTSREVFEESLDIIMGLWSTPEGETFSYHGTHYDFTDIEIFPKPVQDPIPVYMAAVTQASFVAAAKRNIQIMTGPGLQAIDKLKVGNIEAARALIDHGRDPQSIDFPMQVVVRVAETEQKARDLLVHPMKWYFEQLNQRGIHPAHSGKPPKGYDEYIESAKRMTGDPTLDGAIEAGVVLASDPDGVKEFIGGLRDEIGLKNFICTFNIGETKHEEMLETMRIFAEEVMPSFQDETPVPDAFLAPAGA
jgi:alkanesulfonate monooxygenase SsuD/methylene tetrahydromethanopterin reductase-like flavin-dependent oxidoreductase (luciferase family)